MGNVESRHSSNDFELTVRAAKELEHLLAHEFGAQGQGLHQKISSAQSAAGLPQALVKKMRYLATLRNRLVHERDFNAVPDRERFIRNFEESKAELMGIVAQRGGRRKKKAKGCCVIV
ncbi:unnamed protein product [Ostreobium quekettii]|uniref:DUF4145 domain-containing protein n=1 Tax=Ostreobium quekettii TaxID=121088 RepID=A0A8S1INP5_9CHLO|nr:unnamed protein product [Ostreobium quekettii]